MIPQIRLLGGCSLSGPDGRRIKMQTRKSWGLLAYLAASGGRAVAREELAALLWPAGREGQGRASLRQELAVLRKALRQAGADVIEPGKEAVSFAGRPGLVDAADLEAALDSENWDDWRRGIALYRGDFLAGLTPRAAPFEEWLWLERQRLKNRVTAALQKLLDRGLEASDPAAALATAERLLAVEPTHEPAYRTQMRLLRLAGRRAEALQLYNTCRAMLRRELDAEPSRETAELAEEIRIETGMPDETAGRRSLRHARLTVLCMSLTGPADPDMLHDPDTLGLVQERFRQRAERVVASAGGTALPGIGDRFVAIFGYPEARREDSESAVRAALALASEPFSITASGVLWPCGALARGEVLYAPRHADGTGPELIGAALLRAARLAHSARGGQVIAGSDVTSGLGGRFVFEPVDTAGEMPAPAGMVIRRARADVTV